MDNLVKKPYYQTLDGVRGIAIIMVIGFHNFGYVNFFKFGWLGVDLFFVLSGYLITNILLRTIDKKKFLKTFFINRALRILPVYYFILFICLFILSPISFLKDNLEYYINNQLWLWTFLQNWLYIFKKPENTHFLVHFWSLAIEEQFYLVWPFLILLIRTPKTLLLTVVIFLLLVNVTRILLSLYDFNYIDLNYLFVFSRVDGICIGCILALIRFTDCYFIKNNIKNIIGGIILLNIIFYLINMQNNFTYPYFPFIGYTTFSIIFALLIDDGINGKIKTLSYIYNLRLLKFLGKISYGIYLLHVPIYKFIAPKIGSYLITKNNFNILNANLTSSFISTLIVLFMSIISFYTIERYFRYVKASHELSLAH